MTLKQKILALGSIATIAVVIAACTQNESVANESGIHFVNKDGTNANVVAKYQGKEISVDELEKASPDIYSARLEVYKAQKTALEDFIRNSVLEGLAKKANLPMEDFMKKEMEASKKKVSDKDVEAFLKERKVPDTSKVPPDVKDQVRGLLHIQKLVANETKGNQVEFYLKRPRAVALDIKTEGEPMWGNADAPIKVIEFADFQCYYCGQARERLAELKKTYGKKLQITFKHYPLPSHTEARPAAEASMCINEQGSDKFWKYYDVLFDNQKQWTEEDFKEYAKKVGADVAKFDECFKAKKYAAHIDKSVAEGQKLGVNSTPSFFVNSQLIKGAQPIAEFKEVIEQTATN
ncbi:MAG: DsbA family protein [Bdellovibrionota bacterium]